jgi:hypothetical protein
VLAKEMSIFVASGRGEQAEGKRREEIDEVERFWSNRKVWSI